MASKLIIGKLAAWFSCMLGIILLLPVTAYAMDFQFYGKLDGGFYSRSSKTEGHFTQPNGKSSPFSIKSGSSGIGGGLQDESRVGLRGSHDLGGGNRVFFQLEEDIDIATGHRSRDRGIRVIGIGG